MKKIDLNRLEGRQIATDNEPQIPYADIEMIALKINEIIDMLDGLSFEKKEEQNNITQGYQGAFGDGGKGDFFKPKDEDITLVNN